MLALDDLHLVLHGLLVEDRTDQVGDEPGGQRNIVKDLMECNPWRLVHTSVILNFRIE